MPVKDNGKMVAQVEKDVPRTFGNKKVDNAVLETLKDILLELDDYIQGTNIFIGKELLKYENRLPKKEDFKPLIDKGNKYVENVKKVINNISNPNKGYHLPDVGKKESVDQYLARLKSTWPRLNFALQSVLFKKLAAKHYDVEKNLSSLVRILDSAWGSLAVGGGNSLTTDRNNREEWRDVTYDTLGGGSGKPEEILADLREVFVTLILTEGNKVADFVISFN